MVPDLQEDETFWPAVDASALRVRHPYARLQEYHISFSGNPPRGYGLHGHVSVE